MTTSLTQEEIRAELRATVASDGWDAAWSIASIRHPLIPVKLAIMQEEGPDSVGRRTLATPVARYYHLWKSELPHPGYSTCSRVRYGQ